jgi:hypothetical protein
VELVTDASTRRGRAATAMVAMACKSQLKLTSSSSRYSSLKKIQLTSKVEVLC